MITKFAGPTCACFRQPCVYYVFGIFLFVMLLLCCLPPILIPYWWCLVGSVAYVVRHCMGALICCVLCVGCILLSWAVFLHFSNLAIMMLLSPYPYAILVMCNGHASLCHGSLHSGTDLLCVLCAFCFLFSFWVCVHVVEGNMDNNWYVLVSRQYSFTSTVLPSLCCLCPLPLGRVGDAD